MGNRVLSGSGMVVHTDMKKIYIYAIADHARTCWLLLKGVPSQAVESVTESSNGYIYGNVLILLLSLTPLTSFLLGFFHGLKTYAYINHEI